MKTLNGAAFFKTTKMAAAHVELSLEASITSGLNALDGTFSLKEEHLFCAKSRPNVHQADLVPDVFFPDV